MRHFNEYQHEAMGFRLPTADGTYAQLNLAGEVGELLSLIAKARRDGPKADYRVNVLKELGDIVWSVAAIAADHGYSLQDVADANLDKLSSRSQRGVLTGSGDNR